MFKIFGIEFNAKRIPKWASYTDVLALSATLHEMQDNMDRLYNAVEAMRKKVYRDNTKADVITEPNTLVREVPPSSLHPGDVLTEEQIRQLEGG